MIKKYFNYLFLIFYKYYDSDWDDPFLRTFGSISLLLSSIIFSFLKIIFYYTGIKYIYSVYIYFGLAFTGFIFFYIRKKYFDNLLNQKINISKKDKYIVYLIIAFLILLWFLNGIIKI